jgi:hypothetical protein
MRARVIVAAALLLGLVAWDFVAATTFVGDDYLFLAFARLEPNPLLAFVRDMHGGEYYRPLPMLLWWLLGRVGQGAEWPFALAAFLLHAGSAALVVALGRGVGFTLRVSLTAGALFLVAPAEREAALWFAASTDLLATLATLAALVCLLRDSLGWRVASVLLAVMAYFSKETALVLPLLGVAAKIAASSQQTAAAENTEGRGEGTEFIRGCLASVLPHVVVAAGYLVVRSAVLGGLGGTNDPVAPWWGRGLQVAAGLVHAVTAYAPLPDAVAWIVGGIGLVVAGVLALRARRVGSPPALRDGQPALPAPRASRAPSPAAYHRARPSEASGVGRRVGGRRVWEPFQGSHVSAWFPVIWVLLACLPLPAAGWVVGARYFYLPAVGLVLMLALAVDTRGAVGAMVAIALLAVMGLGSTANRMDEVRRYRAVMAAARVGVATGVQAGHTIFLVRNGVKDLDLAVKLTSPAGRLPQSLLVIPDVPASFVWMPDGLASRAGFLLARPPLPPAGEYRFGGQHIMGLARREESPDLDDVLARLPELRIIELVADRNGQISAKDRTDPRP